MVSDEAQRKSSKRVPTGIELTALDPEFRADPYPAMARVREAEAVHYDAVLERWVLTRAEDIDRVIEASKSINIPGETSTHTTSTPRSARYRPTFTKGTSAFASGPPSSSEMGRAPSRSIATTVGGAVPPESASRT